MAGVPDQGEVLDGGAHFVEEPARGPGSPARHRDDPLGFGLDRVLDGVQALVDRT
ncbi:hypothetical protein [Streptomyces sp. NPDC021224]|uniref:hypothetical protein n=1 Tax=unclassified Streptomyces TaxID=2593676 RepID=UPI0037A2EFF7